MVDLLVATPKAGVAVAQDMARLIAQHAEVGTTDRAETAVTAAWLVAGRDVVADVHKANPRADPFDHARALVAEDHRQGMSIQTLDHVQGAVADAACDVAD